MRRKLGIAIPTVVLAVAGGLLMTTSASGQTVLHVTTAPTGAGNVTVHDGNRPGLRLGDRIAARGPLLDEARSERVGTAYLHCLVHRQIIDPSTGLWNCNYVLELADGDLVLQGLDPRGPGEYEVAVIGGTGAYAGATGDATFTDFGTNGDDYTDMMIRLGG